MLIFVPYILIFFIAPFVYGNTDQKEEIPVFSFQQQNFEDCVFCSQFVGKSLEDCMKMQDDDGYKANLKNLNSAPYQRKKYLEGILKNQQDFETFLNRFTPKEWEQFFWHELKQEEQCLFPKNKEDLSAFVRKKQNKETKENVKFFLRKHPFIASVGTTSFVLVVIISLAKYIM